MRIAATGALLSVALVAACPAAELPMLTIGCVGVDAWSSRLDQGLWRDLLAEPALASLVPQAKAWWQGTAGTLATLKPRAIQALAIPQKSSPLGWAPVLWVDLGDAAVPAASTLADLWHARPVSRETGSWSVAGSSGMTTWIRQVNDAVVLGFGASPTTTRITPPAEADLWAQGDLGTWWSAVARAPVPAANEPFSYTLRLTPQGLVERTEVPSLPVADAPVDIAGSSVWPANTWWSLSIAFDPAKQASGLVGWAAGAAQQILARQGATGADAAAIRADADAWVKAEGLGASTVDALGSCAGTWSLACWPDAAGTMRFGLRGPRSPVTSDLTTRLCAALSGRSARMIALRVVSDEQRVVLTTDPTFTSARTGGWAERPDVVAARAALPADAWMALICDTPRWTAACADLVQQSPMEKSAGSQVAEVLRAWSRHAPLGTMTGVRTRNGPAIVSTGTVPLFAMPLLFTAWTRAILAPARERAVEAQAVALLKRIHRAEITARAAGTIDRNQDGIGEYATLSDLAQLREHATTVGDGGIPEALDGGSAVPTELARVDPVVAGYRFALFLPKDAKDRIDPVEASRSFICYAWPVDGGTTAQCLAIGADGHVRKGDLPPGGPVWSSALAEGRWSGGMAWNPVP